MSRIQTNILQTSRIKPTKAREKILEICMASDIPLEVATVAHAAGNEIHLATIYRTLEKFVSVGIINKINFLEGKFRYEYPQIHHHHAICERCGNVENIVDTATEITCLESRVKSESGFSVSRHILELFGTCNKCQN